MCGIRVLFQLTYKISGGGIFAVRAPHLQFLGLFRTNRKSHLSWTAEACVTCAELSAGAFSYLACKSHPVSMRIQKQRHGLTNETKCLSSFKTWGNITLWYNWWFRLMCLHQTPRSPSLTRIISHQPANPTTNQQVDNCYDIQKQQASTTWCRNGIFVYISLPKILPYILTKTCFFCCQSLPPFFSSS